MHSKRSTLNVGKKIDDVHLVDSIQKLQSAINTANQQYTNQYIDGEAKPTLKNTINILETLSKLCQVNKDILNHELEEKSQKRKKKYTQPNDVKCLKSYLKKADTISKTSVHSIISELQYHRGVLSVPGTNKQVASFKEKDLTTRGSVEQPPKVLNLS